MRQKILYPERNQPRRQASGFLPIDAFLVDFFNWLKRDQIRSSLLATGAGIRIMRCFIGI
jgi:hypothetical protein